MKPNLIKLSPQERRDFERKVGDIENYKIKLMHTSKNIAHFDLYKDIDTPNRTVYVALKKQEDVYENYETNYDTLY